MQCRLSQLKEPDWTESRLAAASHGGIHSDSEESTPIQETPLPIVQDLGKRRGSSFTQASENGVMGETTKG